MDIRIFLIGVTIYLTQAYETYETLNIVGSWQGGFDTRFSLHPTKHYNGWCIHIVLDQPVDCVLIWRAKLVNTTHCRGNREFLAVNEWFDQNLEPGHTEDFTLQVWHSYDHTVNGRIYLKDSCSTCLYSNNLPDYTSAGGPGYEKCTGKKSPPTTSTIKTTVTTSSTTVTTSPSTTTASTSHTNNTNIEHITTTMQNPSVAYGGQNLTGIIQSTQLHGSRVNITATTSQIIGQTGTATSISSLNGVGGVVTVQGINTSQFSQIDGKSTAALTLPSGQGNNFTAIPGYINGDRLTTLSLQNSSFSGQNSHGSNSFHGKTRHNYINALELSILFYNSQRSGKLPANNTILWRGDSATNDSDHGIDLTGGWYDAGDYMKFNFPMSASTTNLLWGLEKWKDGYKDAGQLDIIYDMIKWPLDYFLKCWRPQQQEYYVQVGDGPRDHAYNGRPEDMHMKRPSYKITTSNPGSDVAGETAASLAAGSIVFKSKDITYSSTLLDAAKSLYTFAKDNKGIYSESVPQANMYYGSFKYTDELCEGAAWLYKATNDEQYLQDAISFYTPRHPKLFNWEDKDISCQMLLYEITGENKYKDDVESFIKSYLPGGNVTYTPCGLAFVNGWGTLRYSANAAFIALLAAENGIGDDQYKQFALSQINYMLGDNNKNISYEIGFGSYYPRHPYHKSSLYNNAVLKGALVGGPDKNDNYQDKQYDYQKNEVACDFNAGFQSALAGLIHFANNSSLPIASPSKC